MNFGFTEEQELLRAEVRKFLDQNCPLEEVRKIAATPEGVARPLWNRMAELGWVSLTLPDRFGGIGLGWVDLVVVLEETGRSLFPSPLIATVLGATALQLAGSEAQQKRWLPGIGSGQCLATLALLEASDRLDPAGIALEGKRDGSDFLLHGEKLFVMDAGIADLFVVAFRSGPEGGDVSLALVEKGAPGLAAERLETMDETKRLGRVRFDDVRVPLDALLGAPNTGWPVIARLLDCGAVAVTAEAIGAAEGALDLTVRFAKQRIQFDHPIGRFQGVKHPLAGHYVAIESVKSLLYYAAWMLDEQPEAASLSVSRAKAWASDAFAGLGVDAVGLHGAIGYTWEFDAQLYLKRMKWVRAAFGDAGWHLERVAALGGL
ncbi:MAG: acyl-CoA dehydrogenase family protein [Candidatus Limnocylindria bacterium]|jgi:alkylation response protein AidB-like acyl-CoA dehydrogenase